MLRYLHIFHSFYNDSRVCIRIVTRLSKFIETIELTINGGVETSGILKLAVSAKGEGRLKLTLKPKSRLK